MEKLSQHIEALIYASEYGIGIAEIKQVLESSSAIDLEEQVIIAAVEEIKNRYLQEAYILELRFINNGYQFLTKPLYYDTINQLQSHRSKKKLSPAALETLAIIAYRQPITKLEIEQIRGVNCDYSVQRLLEKELIKIMGKSNTLGKPILYGTSDIFMDHFGIANTADLPKLKEIVQDDNTIGNTSE
ncbi:segregation and condensation protein B [Parapedobacter pyrenivorans]|uniref:Segregation and condensation protein B n=1 Tax=Parapedobacter pyrenivorans TaxID=1305674 RepID=A0A917HWZ0_9SPHI|nr:SMC-Scp complex subunit ScpB [Parapedobacter pyrenivorans]GGG93600.1 segregation and condensation protein B [Parapedobacter pyrenivorans]